MTEATSKSQVVEEEVQPFVSDTMTEMTNVPETEKVSTPVEPEVESNANLELDLVDLDTKSGHFTPLDLSLRTGEYSDSSSYMKRLPVLSVHRAKLRRVNGDSEIIISVRDLKSLDDLKSRFLLEPTTTVSLRSKMAYFNSSKVYDLKSLSQIQRKLYRSYLCQYTDTGLYSVCDNRCKNCLTSMYSTDAGHGRIALGVDQGIAINTGRVINL